MQDRFLATVQEQVPDEATARAVLLLGDGLYPDILDVKPDDFSDPLQLLAESIAFTDPVSGEERCFTTRLVLDAWPGAQDQGEYPGNPLSASAPNSCRL